MSIWEISYVKLSMTAKGRRVEMGPLYRNEGKRIMHHSWVGGIQSSFAFFLTINT